MRALLKSQRGPGLELVERPEPIPGPTDVKVRVERTGICGTDLHIERWDAWAEASVASPLIVGHEFSGVVAEVGEAVTSVAVGDRVSGEGHIVCGTCRNCLAGRRHLCIRTQGIGVNRDGAFADFVVLPATNVWVHRREVTPDLAAIFDPLGNAVHTALSFPLVGEDVLITGAGPIGLMAAAVARHAGARYVVVTDVVEERLALAREMGADLAIDVSTDTIESAISRLGMREGFDIGLEMSGAPTALPSLVTHLTHGGRIALLGLPSQPVSVDWGKVISHMITIKGIYGREMFETWYAMSSMLASGLRVETVITDRFDAADWQDAFRAAGDRGRGKVIMDWTAA